MKNWLLGYTIPLNSIAVRDLINQLVTFTSKLRPCKLIKISLTLIHNKARLYPHVITEVSEV